MIRHTVRVRLTALYSALFLSSCTIVLVVVNLLVRHMLAERIKVISKGAQLPPKLRPGGDNPPADNPTPIPIRRTNIVSTASDLRDDVLRYQWEVTVVLICVLAVVSVIAGWLVAGRILRPVHAITETARQLSLSNLKARIALKGPRDELRDLADTFDDMLDRLERSADSQRRFVENASHELRTPLAIQRTAIEVGLDDPSPERLAQVRSELLDVNRRSERVIEGLLVLARGQHGLDQTEPVALDEVVRRTVAESERGDVEVAVVTEPTTVQGDEALLQRLVANLIDNAVRYNDDRRQVRVALGDAALVVSNSGPAVPPEQLDDLFLPFRRLPEARTKSERGAGLGLGIVASIAAAHGAAISAQANSTGGLTITVRFATG